jgi:hypothetical protein
MSERIRAPRDQRGNISVLRTGCTILLSYLHAFLDVP